MKKTKTKKQPKKTSASSSKKRATTTRRSAFPDFPEAEEAFVAWKKGESLSSIVARYNLPKRDTAYKPFVKLAGGLEGFRALRASGGGGQLAFGGKHHVPTARKREVSSAAPVSTRDEAKVPRNSMKGWEARRVYKPVSVSIEKVGVIPWRKLLYTVMISPKGNEYVEAKGTERADLIRPAVKLVPKRDLFGKIIKDQFWVTNSPDIRFKRLKDSTVVKKAAREEALTKKGLKARAAKVKDKRQKKAKMEKLVQSTIADAKKVRKAKAAPKKTAKLRKVS
jgi:hypothetical protein